MWRTIKSPSDNFNSARSFRSAHLPAFALLCVVALNFLACPSRNETNNSQTNSTTNGNVAATPTSSPATSAAKFDAARAFEYVRRQVEFGARPAGSKELAQTREFIVGEMRAANLKVSLDEFTAQTPVGERRMANITAELAGESADFIIISSHYDTKLFKDQKFVGANDGASSTAVVMELARTLAASGKKPRFTYRFVFFDGEEAFCSGWDECRRPAGAGKPEMIDNTYGSRRYVAQLIQNNEVKQARAMILLDLVGYSNLVFAREVVSTPWLTDTIWTAARELGHGKVFVEAQQTVDDDHTPFIRANIDAVDIIQLDSYPHWHTAQDTLDKISARSLQTVGDVVLASLPRIEEKLLAKRK